WLMLYVRRWVNGLRYWLEHQAVAEFNFADMKPGHFYESASGDRVLFFQAIDPDSRRMQRVFIQTISDDTVTIVSADEAFHQPADDPRAAGFLVCIRARSYDLSPSQDGMSQTVSPELVVKLDNPNDVPIGYKRKAAPTWQLARSLASPDIAELQWRLSTPVSAFLLVLLGFPLGSEFCGVLQPAARRQNLGGTRRREVDPGSLVAASPDGSPDCRTDLELARASAAKGHNARISGLATINAST